MNWMVPESRLDEYQRSILQKCGTLDQNSEWIKGFAGSGKTVLLVYLAQEAIIKNPKTRICIIAYTHALKDLIQTGLKKSIRKTVSVITKDKFLRVNNQYDLILIDEVQDIPKNDLEKIKKRTKKLVIAGDSDQSIYPDISAKPSEIMATLSPRVHQLVILYRLTKRLRNIVKSILPDSSIETARSDRGQDVQVTLAKAKSMDEEIEWLWDKCQKYSDTGDPSVILLPAHKYVQQYIKAICKLNNIYDTIDFSGTKKWSKNSYELANNKMEQAGISLQYLGNDYGSLQLSDSKQITYIMTYHSSKGLDFNTVFLPHLNKNINFWRDSDDTSRRIFFVGATRSRRNLFLSYHSTDPHTYIKEMDQTLLNKVDCKKILNDDDDDDEFVF
jgi:superfamily I DNA/RNA helicase